MSIGPTTDYTSGKARRTLLLKGIRKKSSPVSHQEIEGRVQLLMKHGTDNRSACDYAPHLTPVASRENPTSVSSPGSPAPPALLGRSALSNLLPVE
jgi:hypothetical protein